METYGHDPAAWLLPAILAAVALPWLVGISWAIRNRVRDGAVPLSMGERARRQLVSRR
jgi:hypothetical protein